MKKNLLLILMMFFIILNFSGCSTTKNQYMSGVEKGDMLKVNLPYDLRKNMSIVIKSDAIEKKYGKAYITHKMQTKTYEIRNKDDGSKLIVIYNNDTSAVVDIWQLQKLLAHENFKNIYEGKSTSKDILEIDKYTTVIAMTKNTGISEHRLINNEIVTIYYVKKNDLWLVEKIKFIKPDPSNFVDTFTPEDLLLIN